MLLKKNNKIFFIGIGGSGMAPLALLLKKNGFCVTGSDQAKSLNTKKLKNLGVPVFLEHAPSNIKDCNFIVLSSAITDDNVEKQEAIRLKKILLHRSDILKELINNNPSITVVGTHGKTTTSALIEENLNAGSLKKSIAILGGTNLSSQNYSDLEDFNFLVAEADESDGTFLKYKPDITVLTNIEKDHLDYYSSYLSIQEHFSKHLKNLKNLKILIYNEGDKASRNLAKKFSGYKLSFGLNQKATIYASQIKAKGEQTNFILHTQTKEYSVNLPLLGKHNILNALASFCVSIILKQDLLQSIAALTHFKGIKRRLELIYKDEKLTFYDDYAHNPGKVAAAIEALKKHFPEHKIIILFEPHRFSRLTALYEDFVKALHLSDFTLVFPVFCAGEQQQPESYTHEDLAKGIRASCHKPAEAVYNIKEACEKLHKEITQKTIISSLGAGDISKIAHQIRENIKCKNSLSKGVS